MANITRNLPAFESEARIATTNSADLKNNSFTGCHVIIDVTAVTATPSVVFTVQGLDALSGQYYTLITSAAVTSISTVVLKIYPSLVAVANLTVNDALPMDFRVIATHGDADSITYSVGVNLIE